MSRVAPQTAAQTWSARVSPLSAKAADKGALAARSHDPASLQFLKLAHNLLTKLRQFRPIFASFEPVRLLISMGVKPEPAGLITQRSVVQIHPPQPKQLVL